MRGSDVYTISSHDQVCSDFRSILQSNAGLIHIIVDHSGRQLDGHSKIDREPVHGIVEIGPVDDVVRRIVLLATVRDQSSVSNDFAILPASHEDARWFRHVFLQVGFEAEFCQQSAGIGRNLDASSYLQMVSHTQHSAQVRHPSQCMPQPAFLSVHRPLHGDCCVPARWP